MLQLCSVVGADVVGVAGVGVVVVADVDVVNVFIRWCWMRASAPPTGMYCGMLLRSRGSTCTPVAPSTRSMMTSILRPSVIDVVSYEMCSGVNGAATSNRFSNSPCSSIVTYSESQMNVTDAGSCSSRSPGREGREVACAAAFNSLAGGHEECKT